MRHEWYNDRCTYKKCFKKLHISNKLKNSMKKEEEKVNPNSLLALFMLYFLLGLVGDF